ncbi:MFS transporter [Nocardia halotolerans]|uniref:MFS transporter n=1 Tax=Nocardia halotolerans TaxID=1755878 RepID=A0ABV8VQ41_9NOCA
MRTDDTRRWLALGALALAMLTIGLDVTVLTVAIPTLAVELDANISALQWFSSAYTLALAALMLPAGALGDRFGRKKGLLAALVLFGLASLACAFADSAGQLIAARVVLGIAAAALIPLSMAVLPVLFTDPAQRQRAVTIWVTATALGLPLGPVVGGWLLQHYWWGSVFLINVPLVILGAVAVAALVPESRGETGLRVDGLGAALSATGMLGLTYGFIRIGERSWGDPGAWSVIAASVVLLGAFLWWQRRSSHPLIDLALFAAPGFRWGTALSLVVSFAMFGMFFTLPQYLQAVLGVDALGSGLRLLPLIGGLVVGSRLVDLLLPRLGARVVLTAGFLVLACGVGLGALTRVDSGFGLTALWTTVLGAGMGVVMPAAMGLALGELTTARSGSGSALLQAIRQAGGTIGVAVLGTVLATAYRSDLGELNRPPISDGVNAAVAATADDPAALARVQHAFVFGMDTMLGVCAVGCLIAAVVVAVGLERRPVAGQTAADTAESMHAG